LVGDGFLASGAGDLKGAVLDEDAEGDDEDDENCYASEDTAFAVVGLRNGGGNGAASKNWWDKGNSGHEGGLVGG
jgi:hypothetical protein